MAGMTKMKYQHQETVARFKRARNGTGTGMLMSLRYLYEAYNASELIKRVARGDWLYVAAGPVDMGLSRTHVKAFRGFAVIETAIGKFRSIH